MAAPVAEETGLKQPALIGRSMGGTVGTMLAARFDFIDRNAHTPVKDRG